MQHCRVSCWEHHHQRNVSGAGNFYYANPERSLYIIIKNLIYQPNDNDTTGISYYIDTGTGYMFTDNESKSSGFWGGYYDYPIEGFGDYPTNIPTFTATIYAENEFGRSETETITW